MLIFIKPAIFYLSTRSIKSMLTKKILATSIILATITRKTAVLLSKECLSMPRNKS